MSQSIKEQDFVFVAGEGGEVFVVEKIAGGKALVRSTIPGAGFWEPLKKLTLIPAEKVRQQTIICFDFLGD